MIIAFPRAQNARPRIGRALAAVREARGFSLEHLARKCGVGAARLAMAQKDQLELSAAELHAVINVLHIPLGLLFCARLDFSMLRRINTGDHE